MYLHPQDYLLSSRISKQAQTKGHEIHLSSLTSSYDPFNETQKQDNTQQ